MTQCSQRNLHLLSQSGRRIIFLLCILICTMPQRPTCTTPFHHSEHHGVNNAFLLVFHSCNSAYGNILRTLVLLQWNECTLRKQQGTLLTWGFDNHSIFWINMCQPQLWFNKAQNICISRNTILENKMPLTLTNPDDLLPKPWSFLIRETDGFSLIRARVPFMSYKIFTRQVSVDTVISLTWRQTSLSFPWQNIIKNS